MATLAENNIEAGEEEEKQQEEDEEEVEKTQKACQLQKKTHFCFLRVCFHTCQNHFSLLKGCLVLCVCTSVCVSVHTWMCAS